MKEKNKILLFGSTGFIASNFIKNNKSYNILSLDRKNLFSSKKKNNYSFYKIDLNSKNLDFSKFDFHDKFECAILTSYNINFKNKSSKKYIKENINIINNSLKICKKNNIKKIIYISSAAVYGIKQKKIKETFSLNPINAYGESKVLTENLIKNFAKNYNVNYCIFRIFNAYGFHQNNIICKFLDMKNKNIPIRINGNGDQIRDFIYIDDIINAFKSAIEFKKKIKKTFNLCTSKPISMGKIIKKITNNYIHVDPIPEPKSILGSISSIKKTLNWKPKINIDKGLSKINTIYK